MIRPLKNGRVRQTAGKGPRLQRPTAKAQENWLEGVAGSFKDEPDFAEVFKLGHQARRRYRPCK